MSAFYTTRDTCRLCGSQAMNNVAPLQPIPIATPNVGTGGMKGTADIFTTAVPLDLFLCADCGQLQVNNIGNADLQYAEYTYTTSISLGLAEHFAGYARDLLAENTLSADALVVEFGSNDGTLLRHFKDAGMRVQGIDPARAIAEAASKAGIETWAEFFSVATAARVRVRHGLADIIIANNVIANIDDLNPIADGVKALLAPAGRFYFETQYGADVIEKLLLDTVYHEHLSYFNVAPLAAFFRRFGLRVVDVRPIPTKGGSIRVAIEHADGPSALSERLQSYLDREAGLGMHTPAFYTGFIDRINDIRDGLAEICQRTHGAGQDVAGFGVSVGTTTLLAQFGLTDKIDMLFDDDPQRAGSLSGPGYRIPVFTGAELAARKPGVVIVFAWRYIDAIASKQKAYFAQGGQFIVPLPAVAPYKLN